MDTDSHILWTVVAMSACAFGCQDGEVETEEDNPCDDPTSLTLEAPADMKEEPTQVASLVLDELALVDDAGARDVSGMLSAVFADITEYEEETTLVSPFGPACVARVGEPEETEGPTPMVVGSVVFKSEFFGERSLVPDENGRIAPLIEDAIFSKEGGETVEITVTSAEGTMAFPGFEASIAAPKAVEVTSVDAKPDTSLEIGWPPSAASYMEIKMTAKSPDPAQPPNRLRCYFLEDDGCFTVPADAMEWLTTARKRKEVTLRVERHSFSFVVASEKALAEVDAMRSIELDIQVE